ncbi:F-box protein At3g56470-like [Papaver somniferum]|uniref:F-box protein At3g56470-like n=1 Tax=Papaver somniferum TaxID=3469 RepID=UPI000E7021C2|nr:F-box protein At3g56470-like [Papaver somniferum]
MMPVSKRTFATTSITKTSNLFPWLVFCEDNNDIIYCFVIPVHNEYYLLEFSELLLDATICFQKDGWLLMSREEILFFYNPFTRETINLPHVGHHFSSSICFCSLPTSADCTVFAIDQSDQGTITVYSITRGKQVWDIFNFDNAIQYRPLCNPPILHQGAFYCVDYNGLLGAFNWKDKTWKVHGIPRERYSDTYTYPSFLVKSGEDLLLVKLGCQEKLVTVLNFDLRVNDWVEVESLGKHMLFISHTSCFSAIAPNSQMENKIYLPRLCLNGDGILFYSLETGRYDSFGGWHTSKNLYETESWRANCTWIEPNWSKFTPRELNWVESPS